MMVVSGRYMIESITKLVYWDYHILRELTYPMSEIRTSPRNFSQDFVVGGEKVTVEFVTMNIKEKRTYQVYLPWQGKKLRIHMQINDKGNFYITMPDACPEPYLQLEAAFAEAIVNS